MCRLLSLLDTQGMINVNENGQLSNSNLYTEKCSYYAIFYLEIVVYLSH